MHIWHYLFYNLESEQHILASTNTFCNFQKELLGYLDNRRSRLEKAQLVLKDMKTIKDVINRNTGFLTSSFHE